jgi:uncharacterized Zn finger protein
MSEFEVFRSKPKRTPPAHGIKMKKAGATWWGQRWIEALQAVLRGDAGRLARGRTYARAGRTHDFAIEAGKVRARVTGSRAKPYEVTLALSQLTAAEWQGAIAGMTAKAQFAAELLAGRMPTEIDAVFRAAGSSLFPQERSDLSTACDCPDWGDPCKHVAATHYVLGEALDRDPFLLFELRGRSKREVLAALRTARADETAVEPKRRSRHRSGPREPEHEGPVTALVVLSDLPPADYERARKPLPDLHFSFEPPTSQAAALRQLGVPAAWSGDRSPAEEFADLVSAAAAAARRIALSEVAPTQEAPPVPPPTAAGAPRPKSKRR